MHMCSPRCELCSALPRVVLCCLAVLAVHSYFVVEQPRQSVLFEWFRWQWLQNMVCYVPGLISVPVSTCGYV